MRLSTYLGMKQLTLREFGERIGSHASQVSRYAKGSRFPNPDIIKRIALATRGAVTANDHMEAWEEWTHGRTARKIAP